MPTNDKLQSLAHRMEYPGRFLILGNTATNMMGIYGVTARSQSSRAKRYIYDQNLGQIKVEPTDAAIMAEGNLKLLDYTAVQLFPNGIVLSNGRQINRITNLNNLIAQQALENNLALEEYEPDQNCTPRITGCSAFNDGKWTQALHIIRNDGTGASQREVFTLNTDTPGASFVSTYAGPNARPTPSFTGGPIDIGPMEGTAEDIAHLVYDAFAPLPGKDDLRVSVVVMLLSKTDLKLQQYVVNYTD